MLKLKNHESLERDRDLGRKTASEPPVAIDDEAGGIGAIRKSRDGAAIFRSSVNISRLELYILSKVIMAEQEAGWSFSSPNAFLR
jgi:hypothetical protein